MSQPGRLAAATATLVAAGVASPRHDAEALAAHLLGARRGGLTAREPDLGPEYDDLVARRAAREPLQHLTGSVGFRRLDLAVGPGVFIPRPETECLVGWALDALRGRREPLVVDLCTGTAAIALAVADELPGARVHAVDSDPVALAWARRNVADTGLPVTLHLADAASALPALTGRVDAVLANPPYLPVGLPVEPEVARHDPPAALWGGPDGLATVRVLAARAATLLRPGGLLAVEHGDDQGAAVAALLADAGDWTDIADHADLTGRPRFASANRNAPGRPRE